jgi:hypothetical protein
MSFATMQPKLVGSILLVLENAPTVPMMTLTLSEGADDLMALTPQIIEADFKVSAVGTLVTGQWFAKHANTSRLIKGEYPLLLVTGGVLHQVSLSSSNCPRSI